MNDKKRLINFLSTYVIPKNFRKSKTLKTLADHLFKKLEIIDEDEHKIKKLILGVTPLPPFIKHSLVDLNNIDDEMITELLNSYIADGGTREFKDILDPPSDEPISDSDNEEEVVNKYIHYIDYSSNSDSE